VPGKDVNVLPSGDDQGRLIVDGALERGLITKPVEPETLVDFSFAKGL
jgi:hypothetical protein